MFLSGYRVGVIGAGVAGLACAYMLAREGAEVVVFERDPPPPEDPELAFSSWKRLGASQVRHSHVFLGRLRVLLRDHYPELLQELLRAGFREMRPIDNPPPALRGRLEPEPGDDDLVALAGRRVTFEWVLRRVIGENPRVQIETDSKVLGLLAVPTVPPQVCGVLVDRGRSREAAIRFHFVVDASGRHSTIPRWLQKIGCRPVVEQQEESGIVYYTRFYRRRAGSEEPKPGQDPWVADWDWLKFALFPAEGGVFSITLAVPLVEPRLKILSRAAVFDRIVRAIPGLRDWVDPDVAEPYAAAPREVEAMGGLMNRRRRFVDADGLIVSRLFVIGDAAYCTNPLYGRGCAQAFLHAHLLLEALREAGGDPQVAATQLDELAQQQLSPFYRASVVADRDAVRRALGKPPVRFLDRVQEGFFRDGVAVAMRTDPVVYRAFLRMINMFETPEQAFLQPEVVARTLWVMSQGEAFRRRHGWRPPPARDRYLMEIGIPSRE
ncbi:MAG: FAD-dependent oxidoreductase [Candidatus Binatia bacterium]|nr:FAD-dependent oxidoreductase [Candidatus Binatia bacterium]